MPTARSPSAASRAMPSRRNSSSEAEAARLDDELAQPVKAGRMRARAEIGEDARHARREVARCQGKAASCRHRTLLVQKINAIQGEQGLAQASDGAESAARQVG